MEGSKTSFISVWQSGAEMTYRVGRNEAGEIVGIVENECGKKIMTETETNLHIINTYRDRKKSRLAMDHWSCVRSDTEGIRDNKRLLANIQATKKANGIPLDMPEVS